MRPETATSYAQAAATWTDLDWWHLEGAAFDRDHKVRQRLAMTAPYGAWQPMARNTPKTLGCLMVPLHISAVVMPLLAGMLMVSWAFNPSDTALVSRAGFMAGFAAAWIALCMVWDSRRPDGRTSSGPRVVEYLNLVPSSVGLVIAVLAIQDGQADSPIWAFGLLGNIIVALVSFKFYQNHGGFEGGQRLYRRQVQFAIKQLGSQRQQEIRTDLQAAIDLLEQRGLITPDIARAYRYLPLGLLGHTAFPKPPPEVARQRRVS